MSILRFLAILLLIGILDTFVLDGINHDPIACEEAGVRRVGLHQGKNEAYFLYFFIAHVYDNILNPWHWTEEMRTEALTSGNYGLQAGMKVADVGCGTGFTTIGVREQGIAAKDIHMLDQSPQQLSKAVVKPQLQGVSEMIEGDSQNLPQNWTSKFDRYVSAGSIEYWPQPQQALDESARILKPGGKAMIIGPVRATNPISRFFCDLWYLFPEEEEYIAWFKSAGYTDINVHAITPDWYQNDRSHGLIMGFAVVGTKPLDWTPPVRKESKRKYSESTVSTASQIYNSKYISLVMSLPRFVLGSVGGLYYAIIPILVYMQYMWFGGSMIATLTSVAIPILALIYTEVMPFGWRPLGYSPTLFNGIRDFYNSSSYIWIRVWGEHMHTGFYDEDADESQMSMDDHRRAQDRMMQKLFSLWSNVDEVLANASKHGKIVTVLDMGCGVGGSSRFIWKTLSKIAQDKGLQIKIKVIGITLSDWQCNKARELTGTNEDITFFVMNALNTEFDDNDIDCVWSLESGEHMPNKSKWLKEINRILVPGGTFLCATWCHRSIIENPLTPQEVRLLTRLCKNYNLPEWVSLEAYEQAASENNMENFSVNRQSWTKNITPFWPGVIRSSLKISTLFQLLLYGNWCIIKGAISAFLMKQGFDEGVLDFGVFTLNKAK